MNKIQIEKQVIGKTVEEAQQLHPLIRVEKNENGWMLVTTDMRSERLNVEVDAAGLIVAVVGWG